MFNRPVPPTNPFAPQPGPLGNPQPIKPGGGTIYPGPSSYPTAPNYPRPERPEGNPGGAERRR
jgi:hypothetical protein